MMRDERNQLARQFLEIVEETILVKMKSSEDRAEANFRNDGIIEEKQKYKERAEEFRKGRERVEGMISFFRKNYHRALAGSGDAKRPVEWNREPHEW